MKYFHSDMAGSLLAAAAGFREGIWGVQQILIPPFSLSEDSEMAKEKDQETLEAEENDPKCGC